MLYLHENLQMDLVHFMHYTFFFLKSLSIKTKSKPKIKTLYLFTFNYLVGRGLE